MTDRAELVEIADADEIPDTHTRVVDPATLTGLDALVTKLTDRRVIFVGESHDRYEDHLNQLAVIRGLHEQDVDLAIGMEMFQQPFQPALDAYIAGEINEEEMLRRTDYFERWRFDYRLYRPILRYAREQAVLEQARETPEGRKLIRAETRTLTRRQGEHVLSYRISLDERQIVLRWGNDPQALRQQRLLFNRAEEARDAYFARLDGLAKQGFIDASLA